MARTFSTNGDRIITSAGALGAFTYGSIVMLMSAGAGPSIRVAMAVQGLFHSIYLTSSGAVNYQTGSTNTAPSIQLSNSEGFALIGITKAAGPVAPRYHKYAYGTDTFTHENSGSSLGDASGGVGVTSVRLGNEGTTDQIGGSIAASAIWANNVLSDSQFESLAFSLQAWLSLGPTAMWVFDQQSVSQPLLDWTGGGANQSSIGGTTVSTTSVPILSYGHPVLLATHASAPPTAAISTLTDDFDDNTVNTTKWPNNYGTVSETGGRARVECSTGYSAYSSAATYSLDTVYVRAYPAAVSGGASGNVYSGMWFETSSANSAGIWVDTRPATPLIYFRSTVASSNSDTSINYDATNHAWWRIRISTGNLLFDTSPDGTTWTNQRSITAPAWTSTTVGYLKLESHRDNGTTNYAEFDNLNVLPASTTANAGQADVGVDAYGITAQTGVTAAAGQAAVGVDGYNPTATLAATASAGQADVTTDAYNPSAVTVPNVVASAGQAAVSVDAYGPTVQTAITATAGQADVTADAYGPTAVTVPVVTANAGDAAVTADAYGATASGSATISAGQAAVGVDAYGPTIVTAGLPNAGDASVAVDAFNAVAQVAYTATAGQADVGSDAYGATVTAASNGLAGTASVDASAFNPSVSTSSSVTVNADCAQVAVDAYGPAAAVVTPAGTAAVGSDAYNASAVTVATGTANAGIADVGVDAYAATAQPALTASAGLASVAADAYGATVSTETSYTAQAGTADVTSTANNAQVLTAVVAAADVAGVIASAYGATPNTAAATVADALVALSTVEAFNALAILATVAHAGVAEVGVEAFNVPKRRRPGTFTAGTTRSRLTAGTTSRPTYTTGSG